MAEINFHQYKKKLKLFDIRIFSSVNKLKGHFVLKPFFLSLSIKVLQEFIICPLNSNIKCSNVKWGTENGSLFAWKCARLLKRMCMVNAWMKTEHKCLYIITLVDYLWRIICKYTPQSVYSLTYINSFIANKAVD